MDEQTHSTEKTILDEKAIEEIKEGISTKQNTSEEGERTSGQTKPEQVDFSQMYDMLTERDETIKALKSEIAELKKSNTNLLFKVNASASGAQTKDPFESFIDTMVAR